MLGRYQLMVDLSGAFGDLFARVDGPLKEIASEVVSIASEIQASKLI